MSQKAERNFKRGIANACGSFGYLFCFLQWLWAVILYLSVIQSMSSFISPSSDQYIEQPPGFTFTLPGSLEMAIIAVIVAIMVVVTIYVFISIPGSIVKTSNKVVHKTAETITPLVIKVQHKENTKRTRITITSRVILVIKVMLITVPVILTVMSRLVEGQALDYVIVTIVGCGLACFSVIAFATQYILAGLLRVKMSDLW